MKAKKQSATSATSKRNCTPVYIRRFNRVKVGDLTRDARLRELLPDEVAIGAARWWNRAFEQAG